MKGRIYKMLLWSGLTLILVFTPLARGTVRTWSITPVLALIYLLVFLWLWGVNNSIARGYTELRSTGLDMPILIFFILVFISSAFSVYKYASFHALLKLLGYVGLYYLISNNYSRALRRYLIVLVIVTGSGISVYGLLQYFGVLPHSWWRPENFLAATYVNHNHFSGYIELVIPVAIGALLAYGPRNAAVFTGLLLALAAMAVAFILAQSRGAWFSLAPALAVMGFFLSGSAARVKKIIFFTALSAFVILALVYSASDLAAPRSVDPAGGEASVNTRIAIWKGTAGMIKDSPVTGTGIGTFVFCFSRYRPEGMDARAHYAHNDYLQVAAGAGIPAAAAMLFILLRLIKTGFGRTGYHPVMLGCATGVLSLSLHALVDFNFHIPANMIISTVYAALIMSEAKVSEEIA